MSTAKKKSARAVADVTAGTVLATVDVAAPPERVFRALTTDEVTRWWGSAETYRTTEWTSDVRVGGSWRARGRGADGHEFTVGGDYVEVDPPRKIVQTWKADWDGGNVTTITYRLEPIAIGTRVVVRHEGFGDRVESCEGHAEGWERVLSWLDAHTKPAVLHFMCRLLPPRPSFMRDMTDDERKIMQEHGAYWRGHLERGAALLFGPVADPKGAFGLGVVRVKDEAELRAILNDDPTTQSKRGFVWESAPMPSVVVRE